MNGRRLLQVLLFVALVAAIWSAAILVLTLGTTVWVGEAVAEYVDSSVTSGQLVSMVLLILLAIGAAIVFDVKEKEEKEK